MASKAQRAVRKTERGPRSPFASLAATLDAQSSSESQLAAKALSGDEEYELQIATRGKFKNWGADLGSLTEPIPGAPSEMKIIAGLHLMFAPAEGGKTLTALALFSWFKQLGMSVKFQSAYEPDSDVPVDNLDAKDKHPSLLKKNITPGAPCVAIFDSLTLALRMLPEVENIAKPLGDQTYTGGLKVADLIGAALHNQWARANHVALIATVNSEMLPIVKPLNGAVMGLWQISSPGVIVGAMRDNRTSRPITIAREHMNLASIAKGYGPYKKES